MTTLYCDPTAAPRKRNVDNAEPPMCHDIRPFLRGIHGRSKEEQKHYELSVRLQIVLGIVKKL